MGKHGVLMVTCSWGWGRQEERSEGPRTEILWPQGNHRKKNKKEGVSVMWYPVQAKRAVMQKQC